MRMKSGQMFAKEDLIRRRLLHDGTLQLKNAAGRLKGLHTLPLSLTLWPLCGLLVVFFFFSILSLSFPFCAFLFFSFFTVCVCVCVSVCVCAHARGLVWLCSLCADVHAMLLTDVLVFLQEKDQKYVFASLVSWEARTGPHSLLMTPFQTIIQRESLRRNLRSHRFRMRSCLIFHVNVSVNVHLFSTRWHSVMPRVPSGPALHCHLHSEAHRKGGGQRGERSVHAEPFARTSNK